MFEQVTKEQREVEKEDKAIKPKVDCRRNANANASPIRERVIKAAQLFQTAAEENAVNKLIKAAEKSEEMRVIAEKASQETLEGIKKYYESITNLHQLDDLEEGDSE